MISSTTLGLHRLILLSVTATSSLLVTNFINCFIFSASVVSVSTAYTFTPATPSQNNTPIMRAWTCHGRTQREMVNKLSQAGIIKSQPVRDCMNAVDRSNYILNKGTAYDDAPQGIGYGQTISAPHMHAHVLEDLLPSLKRAASSQETKQVSILDVGTGSGYLTACFGRLVDRGEPNNNPPLGKIGKVYAIDCVPELVTFSKSNMNKEDKDLIASGTVDIQLGDGWKGLPSAAPFDAIHVGAAADAFPENLMMQLAVGGTLICPVGPDGGFQTLYKIERLNDSPSFQESDFSITQLIGVRYVPLVHLNE